MRQAARPLRVLQPLRPMTGFFLALVVFIVMVLLIANGEL